MAKHPTAIADQSVRSVFATSALPAPSRGLTSRTKRPGLPDMARQSAATVPPNIAIFDTSASLAHLEGTASPASSQVSTAPAPSRHNEAWWDDILDDRLDLKLFNDLHRN